MQPQKSDVGGKIIVAVVAFALGLGAGWYLARADVPFLSTADKKAEEADLSPERKGGDLSAAEQFANLASTASLEGTSLRVEDQPAGMQIFVGRVTHPGSVWVAIHEDHNGEPGNILGAQRFRQGMTSGFVDLLRDIEEGGIYYAVLHNDDGDENFDHTREVPLRNESGDMISVRFNAISE